MTFFGVCALGNIVLSNWKLASCNVPYLTSLRNHKHNIQRRKVLLSHLESELSSCNVFVVICKFKKQAKIEIYLCELMLISDDWVVHVS